MGSTKLTFTRLAGIQGSAATATADDVISIPSGTSPHEFLSGIIKGGGYWIKQGEEQIFIPWSQVTRVVAA